MTHSREETLGKLPEGGDTGAGRAKVFGGREHGLETSNPGG